MNKFIARFLLANSPWSAFWSNWMLGFIVVGPDGEMIVTEAGHEFMDWIDA